MSSVLKFKVLDQPGDGEKITLSTSYNSSSIGAAFVTKRLGHNQITIGSTLNETAKNIVDAFAMDYYFIKSEGNFNYQLIGNEITFEVVDQSNVFDTAEIPASMDPSPSITNPSSPVEFQITVFEYQTADTNKCLNFKVHLTTSENTYSISYGTFGNEITEIVNSNDFTIELPRGSLAWVIELTDYNSNTITKTFFPIRPWQIGVDVNETPQGATVTLNKSFNNNTGDQIPLAFTYSIDGIDFVLNNIWTGLPVGSYTGYVRDNFGCTKTIDFEITGILSYPDPYIFVSMLNSIRFARRNDGRRNYDNLESYEDGTETNYQQFHHLFQQNDVITTQFKSSYSNHKVRLIRNGISLQDIPITKKTNNINRNDFRQAFSFARSNGKLGVYYSDDLDTLDPVTGVATGTSTLEGTLLSPQIAGFYVEIEGYGWLPIDHIEVDGSKGYFMAFDTPYSGGGVQQVSNVRTIYSIEDFDVYEFTIDWTNLDGCYQIGILADSFIIHGGWYALKYLSEPIMIGQTNFEDYHIIDWKNSTNNQILWETGMQSKAILPRLCPPTFEPQGDTDVYMTYESAEMLESEVRETFTFHFDLLPLSIARQIAFMISNDYLIIDGIRYVKEENPEIEAKIGSNLYEVKVKLTKADAYNSNSEQGDGFVGNGNGYLEVNGNGYLEL